MKCGTCNYPEVKKTTTTVDEWVGGQLVAVRDVPVEKCPQCGEEYYSPGVLKALERIVALQEEPVERITVPVFGYHPVPI